MLDNAPPRLPASAPPSALAFDVFDAHHDLRLAAGDMAAAGLAFAGARFHADRRRAAALIADAIRQVEALASGPAALSETADLRDACQRLHGAAESFAAADNGPDLQAALRAVAAARDAVEQASARLDAALAVYDARRAQTDEAAAHGRAA